VITGPALVSWLSRYWGLAGVRVTEHNGGMGSETWFVDGGDQRWVAKRWRQAVAVSSPAAWP
jgi:hypothetical protein